MQHEAPVRQILGIRFSYTVTQPKRERQDGGITAVAPHIKPTHDQRVR